MKIPRPSALAAACLAFAAFSVPLSARDASDASRSPAFSGDLNIVTSTLLEAKATVTGTVSVPFLAGEGPLVSGNSVQLKFGAELSPVSVNGTFETVWTPIAFFQLVAGGSLGSGWNIPIANGLARIGRVGAHDAEYLGGPFDGLVWSARGGAVFQFDLAALAPGDWHHVVFRTYQEAKYRTLTSAASGESWVYEADDGRNRNGWNYYGNWFAGYQMPIALETAGVLVEAEKSLYGTAGEEYWGDDLAVWTFGPVLSFRLADGISLAALVQLRTKYNYTDATKDYGFYEDRAVADDPQRVGFYRAAASLSVRLR